MKINVCALDICNEDIEGVIHLHSHPFFKIPQLNVVKILSKKFNKIKIEWKKSTVRIKILQGKKTNKISCVMIPVNLIFLI